jgi:hypothetical protein
MNRKTKCSILRVLIASLAVFATACGSDSGTEGDPIGEPDTGDYVQIEQLARPGISEVFLISQRLLAGYNAAAPTFAGVPAETVDAVVGEAQTVMKALYLSVCLINGALGLAPADGLRPAGLQCHATGPSIWEENNLAGVTLTAASESAAQDYADKVTSQFLPDVLRIDTSAASGYLSLCGDANSTPLLCGGRKLGDDVIDITYNYILAGAAVGKGPYNQVNALVSDGVQFSTDDAQNSGNVTLPDANNTNQYHPSVSPVFPFSAAPL